MGGLEVIRRAMDRIEQARDWDTLHECVQAADAYYQRGELSACQAEDIARACWARSHEIRLRIHRPAPRNIRKAEYNRLKAMGYQWNESVQCWIAPDTEQARALYEAESPGVRRA